MKTHLFVIVVYSLAYVCSAVSQTPQPFSLTMQQRDALAAPVIDDLRNLQQQGVTSLLNYLQSINLGTLDQPEPSESAAAVAGTSLSKLFFGDLRPFDQDRLLDGENLVRTNDEFKTSIALYIAIENLLHDQSVSLINWLATRATKSPTTRCDKVVLACLPSEFNGFGSEFWNGTHNAWQTMLTAKNPAYRLLALRNARFFETNPTALLAHYQSGLTETNTLLQNAAFEGLMAIGTPAAKVALQSFLNQHWPANDGTMPNDFDINADIQEYLTP